MLACLRHCLCVSALLLAAGVHAAPDLSTSTLTVDPPEPLAGDVLRYEWTLRNSGDVDAGLVEIRIDAPDAAYIIDAAGVSDPLIESDERRVHGHVVVPVDGSAQVRIDVLAPRESAGLGLSLRSRAVIPAFGIEHHDAASIVLGRRPVVGGIRIGALQLLPAALWVLGWMLATGLVFLLLLGLGARGGRGLRIVGAAAATLLLMIPLGIWLVFADMARRDAAILVDWQETNGTVVGRRLAVGSTSSTSSGSGGLRRSEGDGATWAPELALRFEAAGDTVYTTGYDSGSALRIGGREARQRELQAWQPGERITLWYDPADPRDAVVRRGFGGAYLFLLLTLPVLWLAGRVTRRVLTAA